MLIDFRELLSGSGNEISYPANIDMTCLDDGVNSYPVIRKDPFVIQAYKTGKDKVQIQCNGSVILSIPCDRCLEDVVHRFEIQLNRSLNVSEDEGNQDLDDVNYIKECHLDVDMLVYEEVSVRLPMKNLCSEDCKGICPVCGGNRNVTECGCDDKVPDPRMADVLSIFDDYCKESSPPKQ